MRLQNLWQSLQKLLLTRVQLQTMQYHRILLLLRHQQMLASLFQLVSRETTQTTTSELTDRMLATFLLTVLLQKSMLLQVVDLLWITYLVAVAINHSSDHRLIVVTEWLGPVKVWGE